MWSRLGIRTKIVLLSFALTLLSVLVGGVILVQRVSSALEEEMGQRAIAIARTVAQMPEIKESIVRADGAKVIQPIAERIRLATDVEYIVVLDMNRIRFSHPLENRIGTVFQGGDEGPAFAEQEYLSHAQGVSGEAVRAFVPVMDVSGHSQVGVVTVGILTPTFELVLHRIRMDLYYDLLIGVIVGWIGSWILAGSIKKQMHDLEPAEMSKLLEERNAVIETIQEGIIAIDQEQRITMLNEHAIQLLGITGDPIGQSIAEVIPGYHFSATSKEPYSYHQTYLLISGIPITVKSKVVGALIILQDRTEAHKLANELSGVKEYVEALRVQNHEHMNKLHTIAGLAQLRQFDELIDYVFSTAEEYGEISRFLSDHFANYSIAGLLLGKYGRAKELGIELIIDRRSHLDTIPKSIDIHGLVIILGNLLDNAFDAIKHLDGERTVYLSVSSESEGTHILVEDNGIGIPDDIKKRIFERGFTTKAEPNRGIGLSLIQQQVQAAGGTIDVFSDPQMGTTFEVMIPMHPGKRRD